MSDEQTITNFADMEASYEMVCDIIRSTFATPGRYTGERILCRQLEVTESWLRRELYWPAEEGSLEMQTLSWTETDKGFEVDQRIGDDERPPVQLRVTRRERGCRITIDGASNDNSIVGEPKLGSAGEIAARIEKTLQERASAPPWVANFFAVLDRLDAPAFGALFHDTSNFQFGATLKLVGGDAVRDHSPAMWVNFHDLSHHLVAVTYSGEAAAVECRTSYHRRSDDTWLTLPAGVFLTREREKVGSIRVYADSTLLGIGWPSKIGITSIR
jgi:ketosteroid isomerase-like protein